MLVKSDDAFFNQIIIKVCFDEFCAKHVICIGSIKVLKGKGALVTINSTLNFLELW